MVLNNNIIKFKLIKALVGTNDEITGKLSSYD